MNETTDGKIYNYFITLMYVQSFNRKFRGQYGLCVGKGSAGIIYLGGACRTTVVVRFQLNNGTNGRIKTSEFFWLDIGLRTPWN